MIERKKRRKEDKKGNDKCKERGSRRKNSKRKY